MKYSGVVNQYIYVTNLPFHARRYVTNVISVADVTYIRNSCTSTLSDVISCLIIVLLIQDIKSYTKQFTSN